MEKGDDYLAATAIAASLIKTHYFEDAEQSGIGEEDIAATVFVQIPGNIAGEYGRCIFTALVRSSLPESKLHNESLKRNCNALDTLSNIPDANRVYPESIGHIYNHAMSNSRAEAL